MGDLHIRKDLHQTSTGVGHNYRPGYYFPSSNFKVSSKDHFWLCLWLRMPLVCKWNIKLISQFLWTKLSMLHSKLNSIHTPTNRFWSADFHITVVAKHMYPYNNIVACQAHPVLVKFSTSQDFYSKYALDSFCKMTDCIDTKYWT